jgi:hypothetical protein
MKKNVFYLLGIILLMASCYPGEVNSYEELDLVYTNYTQTFDFASAGTYVMPDSVVKVTGNLTEGQKPEYVKAPYNKQIIDEIESNMTELGWERVYDPNTADVSLLPAVWTNTTVVYWYDYWCWYDYYYCGWGYYYPYYTSYTTGTLVIGMIASGSDYVEPTSVWTAAANGVMSGSSSISRALNCIDQAFKQSPYLDTK